MAGATGMVGRRCLQLLLNHSAYSRVVSVVRRAQGITHPKYEEIIASFDNLGTVRPVAARDAFCAIGTTMRRAGSKETFHRVDCEYVSNFAYWARAGGADSISVVSSLGANLDSRNFYLATKGEMEEGIREQRFPRAHVFRPGLLLGDREEKRAGERIFSVVMRLLDPLLIGGLQRYRAISAEAVAKAMVAAAQQTEPGLHVHHYQEIVRLAGRMSG